MKRIQFMDVSFRDGFQSCYGARVKTADFIPALEAAVAAGTDNFEIGGGARFQSLYFYCQEDAFEMMDAARKVVGPDINLQTLSRGANVVGLVSQSRDIIDLHARMFKKHGITTIRNFDALMDVRNIAYSGQCIHNAGLKHQVVIALMGLPPGLSEKYCHTPQFYLDKLREILDAGIPFDSVAFKDASGVTTPAVVFEAIKGARKMLPEGTIIQFHTHDTAGMGVACNFAAIEGGADIIDLAMAPVSGGTAEVDILTMWHRMRGTDYTLDIDPEKYIEVEALFAERMEKYYMPPEAKEVNPVIPFSPMPGGALTANTQMMRDNNTLHLFPEVIRNMREVVAKGGFGSSVTPVSQFYFQQAFANTVQGPWTKITDSYGKMVLGYFGKTPAEPDPEVVRLASEQLGLEPTTEDVHDINDRNAELGMDYNRGLLEKAGLPATEENIFIAATCGAKGIGFLKGDRPLGIRYKDDVEAEMVAKVTAKSGKSDKKNVNQRLNELIVKPEKSCMSNYIVTVDGKSFNVSVADSAAGAAPVAAAAKPVAVAPEAAGDGVAVEASLPGNVVAISVEIGDTVGEGDDIVVIEAMKMESPVKSPKAGRVVSIEVSVGDTVATGDVLLYIA
ncbi:biotin attachment protein [Chlorobium phaeovibrioides]|uniref:Biotin attachment protein n=1 Tax=Chlorobium phaeovibrioides TaxID=1094 RepID=A0A3S0LR62_CHLPH|nr:biotin/lipoyl-containing protein [Chlorobium phaeovibrioides]KAA6232705.1 biotin attachment protein [Chlorobium phaeovibrioides]MWV53787.1 biotin attachment protein [Chlorobium phaeovibrioides]QEQ56903.1 biotin attachment protein [Chlorobium phaeovibrioides]RTY37357.1 biotin attachment protein [Chlorobium phaeovibrioides]RTY39852.1 biotin attachment protein [Chlorobium phaeovibrioides]